MAKRQLPTSVVVAVDVFCGVALGLLVWGLTGLPQAGIVIGLVVALGLGLLAIAGASMNRAYRVDRSRVDEAAARRARVLAAFEDTREKPSGDGERRR